MNPVTLTLAAAIGAAVLAALGGWLQRHANDAADARMHRSYEVAPLANDDVEVIRFDGWVADLKDDDSQPLDLDMLAAIWARYDADEGMDYVRDLEARLAAGFGLDTDWPALVGSGAR